MPTDNLKILYVARVMFPWAGVRLVVMAAQVCRLWFNPSNHFNYYFGEDTHLSFPQFFHLENGDNLVYVFYGLVRGLSKIMLTVFCKMHSVESVLNKCCACDYFMICFLKTSEWD